jgi:hypothetical protein
VVGYSADEESDDNEPAETGVNVETADRLDEEEVEEVVDVENVWETDNKNNGDRGGEEGEAGLGEPRDAVGERDRRSRRRKWCSKKTRTSGNVRTCHIKSDWPMPWNRKINMLSTPGHRALVHVLGSARNTPAHAASM